MKNKEFTRRNFLKTAGGCASMTALGGVSSALNLSLLSSARAAEQPYKALVCVFLYGGNDSYNMVAPLGSEYAGYARLRGTAALASTEIAALDLLDTAGRQFGLHSALSPLLPHFSSGKAAVLANIGTLYKPATVADYVARSGILPKNLHSHSDQQIQWQTSLPQFASGDTGWMGRMIDILHAGSTTPVSYSMSGNNVIQAGGNSLPFSVSADGVQTMTPGTGLLPTLRRQGAQSMMQENYFNLYEQAFANRTETGIDFSQTFKSATDSASVETAFPETSIGKQLKMVARTIASRSTLQADSNTFFVAHSGYDTHTDQNQRQKTLLSDLAAGLAAFQTELARMGMEDQVVTFTASDFGRRLQANTNQGTDHGWGGNQIVIGGNVNGNRLYGNYPILDINASLLVQGGILPTLATDEFYAELALWFGVSASELYGILPNLGEFYAAGTTGTPLGLFG